VSEVNRNSEDNPRYRLHHAILAAQLADIERALAASKPKETTEPNSTIGISGSVGPGVSFGTAPSGTFSSVLGGSLHLGEHFSVRVDGRFEPSSEEHRDGVKFNTGLVLGTLDRLERNGRLRKEAQRFLEEHPNSIFRGVVSEYLE
jgi:hypothetical protein